MFAEVESKVFKERFPSDPHPFISDLFMELNKAKVDRVVRLTDTSKYSVGLVAGVKDQRIKSPFSAPFGGFHFRHEQLYVSELNDFVTSLVAYARGNGIAAIDVTLPPDIYNQTFNAKACSVLISSGFTQKMPEITNWVDLFQFSERFNHRSSREYYNQALRHGLTFSTFDSVDKKGEIYDLICDNRKRMGRPIYMSLADLERTGSLWPVDYFGVSTTDGVLVAGAIFYRAHPSIVYAVFWGDSEAGRPLRAMDFLLFNLWSHYKKLGYNFIDLGVSTESGKPNEGLLRFKETHECISSLRYTFSWTA